MYGVVYKITNTQNGHCYIGQTKTRLGARWSKHKGDAKRGAGWVLAAAIRKHGETAFVVEVIERCDSKDALNAAEIRWIAQLNPAYNATAGGGGLGSPVPEVRAKLAAAGKGRKATPEQRKNMSDAQRGHVVSEETKAKIKAALKGRYLRKVPISDAERQATAARNRARRKHPDKAELKAHYAALGLTDKAAKIAAAAKFQFANGARKKMFGAENPMYGTQKPEHVKQRLSVLMAGSNNPFSGQLHTAETRAKMAAAHAARPHVTCPHCGVVGRSNAMLRWHFDNCRSKR